MFERGFEAEEPPQVSSRFVEDPDERAKNLGEKFQRARDHERKMFGALKRKHLRHQFAQDYVQKSYGRECDYYCRAVSNVPSQSFSCYARGYWNQKRRDGRLANPTQSKRSESDAELGGRNEYRRRV